MICLVGVLIYLATLIFNQKLPEKLSLTKSIVKLSQLDGKKAVSSASAFFKIKNEGEALVAEISNPEAIKSNFPFLQQSYKGDILISTRDQTVILDPKTNTLRDISNKSIYNEMLNSL